MRFGFATYPPFLKSGPLSKEVSHVTTAVDIFYSSKRLQIPLRKRLLDICTEGISGIRLKGVCHIRHSRNRVKTKAGTNTVTEAFLRNGLTPLTC